MDPPSNEEGYNGADNSSKPHDSRTEHVCTHNTQCCSHDSMVNRIQALQMSMQSLDFSIREIKEGQSKMLWKLIAVIGVTSFLCGYLGIHNWLNVLFG